MRYGLDKLRSARSCVSMQGLIILLCFLAAANGFNSAGTSTTSGSTSGFTNDMEEGLATARKIDTLQSASNPLNAIQTGVVLAGKEDEFMKVFNEVSAAVQKFVGCITKNLAITVPSLNLPECSCPDAAEDIVLSEDSGQVHKPHEENHFGVTADVAFCASIDHVNDGFSVGFSVCADTSWEKDFEPPSKCVTKEKAKEDKKKNNAFAAAAVFTGKVGATWRAGFDGAFGGKASAKVEINPKALIKIDAGVTGLGNVAKILAGGTAEGAVRITGPTIKLDISIPLNLNTVVDFAASGTGGFELLVSKPPKKVIAKACMKIVCALVYLEPILEVTANGDFKAGARFVHRLTSAVEGKLKIDFRADDVSSMVSEDKDKPFTFQKPEQSWKLQANGKMGGNFNVRVSAKITVLVTPGIPVYVSVMPWLSTEAYMSGTMKFTEEKNADGLEEAEDWECEAVEKQEVGEDTDFEKDGQCFAAAIVTRTGMSIDFGSLPEFEGIRMTKSALEYEISTELCTPHLLIQQLKDLLPAMGKTAAELVQCAVPTLEVDKLWETACKAFVKLTFKLVPDILFEINLSGLEIPQPMASRCILLMKRQTPGCDTDPLAEELKGCYDPEQIRDDIFKSKSISAGMWSKFAAFTDNLKAIGESTLADKLKAIGALADKLEKSNGASGAALSGDSLKRVDITAAKKVVEEAAAKLTKQDDASATKGQECNIVYECLILAHMCIKKNVKRTHIRTYTHTRTRVYLRPVVLVYR